jgi:MEMO1 family protein
MKLKSNINYRPKAEKRRAAPGLEVGDPGVVCAVLMPHAPILVPGVGGDRGDAVSASRQAMRAAAKCVMDHLPETIVLISPHSPRQELAFGLWADDPLQGSFAQFNAPQIAVNLPLDRSLAEAIAVEAHTRDLETWAIHRRTLDHGALVPLWFLVEAGWAGPTVILSLNYPEYGGLTALGEASAAGTSALPRRVAFIASGDMSHRLTANAPCGFHPQAHQFDETFMQMIRAGNYRELPRIAPELRDLAAEDAVDSTLVAAAVVNWQTSGHRVLNYEGPFGVGYGVAILFAENSRSRDAEKTKGYLPKSEGTVLPGFARRSVAAVLEGRSELPSPPSGACLSRQRGVFVTIRHRDGSLRGCVGTVAPVCASLVEETWRNARAAAFHDNRFSPVTLGEMCNLRFEVSVLHPPEPVSSEKDLDPASYGVIVSTEDGRRGLLLPGIKEIRTPEQQLSCARTKGWIGPDEPVTIQRFQVDHFAESD